MIRDASESMLATSLIGHSGPMRRLRATIAKVAASDLTVLIQGPTGSGKELVARAIHILSGRQGRFVAFNVCAIADTVFEDTLFGHARGAFTGAVASRPGYLCESHLGTLFLDEISGLPITAQAKLLRALETREYRPLGATADRRSDFRTVAATNVDLATLVSGGGFRADLRYRLAGLVLTVPTLAERAEDIAPLIAHFARETPAAANAFTPEAVRRLTEYEWPGNVRELRHVVQSLLLMSNGPVTGHDVAQMLSGPATPMFGGGRRGFEGRRTLEVLEEVDWNVPEAARLLGVDKTTVYRRIRRLGLSAEPRARNGSERSSGALNPVAICGATRPLDCATDCNPVSPCPA